MSCELLADMPMPGEVDSTARADLPATARKRGRRLSTSKATEAAQSAQLSQAPRSGAGDADLSEEVEAGNESWPIRPAGSKSPRTGQLSLKAKAKEAKASKAQVAQQANTAAQAAQAAKAAQATDAKKGKQRGELDTDNFETQSPAERRVRPSLSHVVCSFSTISLSRWQAVTLSALFAQAPCL